MYHNFNNFLNTILLLIMLLLKCAYIHTEISAMYISVYFSSVLRLVFLDLINAHTALKYLNMLNSRYKFIFPAAEKSAYLTGPCLEENFVP